jgi:DNA ligase (NAD+)
MPKVANKPIADVVKILKKAKKAYYAGEPIMTDKQFDGIEESLKALDPDNDYFKVVGAPAGNIKEKVVHLNKMLSCGKAKTFEDVEKWANKHGVEKELFIIQPKIDGMSGNCVYENGKLVQICSRGDGEIGQDISHLSKYINVPQSIDVSKGRVEIRGELYLPKNTKAPNPENKPLRNICTGMVGRKDHKLEDLKFVHFVAYQVLGVGGFEPTTEATKMTWLKVNKFEVVEYYLCNLDGLEKYRAEYIETLRESWQYETDGIVIVVNNFSLWNGINSKYEVGHHNHYNIAWKPESVSAETTLISIDWQVSRQGKLIPVAVVEPVVIGGATISRASLTCYDNVIAMKLEKGDKVKLSRRNDVIPYIEKNVSKGILQREA